MTPIASMPPMQVVVMCKAPVAGEVKTRLIGEGIDAERACAWHQQMAQTVIDRAALTFPSRVSIAVDDLEHPFFAPFALPLLPQGGGSLGDRLLRLAQLKIDDAPLLFLGTDSPHMTTSRLCQVAELVKSHDAVAGPVEDGGYDLIAIANRKALVLLDSIDWGSSRVWTQTQQRARAAGVSLAALSTSFDVDTVADLRRSLLLGWE
ncbi:MAG: glycosyltransferase [Mariprofundales bacterium]|nr:glycosyltransferase [Mariprofundales bacterium]